MRAATAHLGALPGPRIRVQLSPRARRRLALAAAALAALATLYTAWFRDSSLVQVEHVAVTGLSVPGAGHLRAELTAAARRMTTLDVDEDALRAAVAHDPIVRSVSVHTDFPSGLRIDVVLNQPVALLQARGRTLAVAADGTLLPGARAGSVPALAVGALPHGRYSHDRRTLLLLAVAAAAPGPLRTRVATVAAERGKGLVARLRAGPEIVFGDGGELAAKWAAAASVLAQGSSAGATYVDVHDPRQPIAEGVTLGDSGLPAAAADPTDPGGPGVIDATPTSAPAQAQAPSSGTQAQAAPPITPAQAPVATAAPAGAAVVAPTTSALTKARP